MLWLLSVKGMNVEYLGHLGKVLVIDEQEQYALVETYNGYEQYAVPMEELGRNWSSTATIIGS